MDNKEEVSAIFYEKPVPLDRDDHKDFKLIPVADMGYDFVATTKAVYITAIEFSEASKEYPIVFVKNDDEFTAMVALSVDGEHNAFVTGKEWDARYLPAFIRRYPFIPGVPSDDTASGGKKFTLMVDESYAGFGASVDGVDLFDNDEPSKELSQITDFVKNYHLENIKTNHFVKTLDEMGLLIDKRLQIAFPDGTTQYSIAGTWVVDEKALKALSSEDICKLHRTGHLYLINLHLSSLRNFSYLAEKQSKEES